MAVSLKNRKNTEILLKGSDAFLIHHGSNTCRYEPSLNKVTLDLCGYDTATTRGKINLFLNKYGVGLSVRTDRGTTFVERDSDKQSTRFKGDPLSFSLDKLDRI